MPVSKRRTTRKAAPRARRSRAPRVFIIGGGLAGMVVAKELAERGVEVHILEAEERLGGKAGADHHQLVGADGRRERLAIEHGFHFFPGWYRNTRALLHTLGVDRHLLDADGFYMIQKGSGPDAVPTMYRTESFDSLRAALHNIFRSVLPWHQALIAFYFTLDLAAESFQMRGFLDRVSVSGFFRSRFYRSEAIAEFHQMSVLQASAIPLYELSAMSFQKVVKAFAWNPSPFVSLLDGDLQTRFIEPFRKHLEKHHVKVHLWQRPVQLFTNGGRVSGTGADPSGEERDLYVIATPPEVAVRLASLQDHSTVETISSEPTALPGVSRLESAPMAAMQVYFDRRIADLPPWHTSLYQSAYGQSFIDISQHWPVLKRRGTTVLSVIAANVAPLRHLKEEEQARWVMNELLEYIGTNAHGQRVMQWDPRRPFEALAPRPHESGAGLWLRAYGGAVMVYWRSNIEAPLFLNTTGAWADRPATRTTIENLYVAGDYCRSEADLTTMESAVMSGLATAREMLIALGKDATGVAPLPLHLPPHWLLRALKYALLPMVLPIGVANAFDRLREEAGRWGGSDA